jgi:hypothetical protein
MLYPNSVSDDIKYKGIGGWLLILCIGCFLGPILYVSRFFSAHAELQPYFSEFPNFFYATIFQYVYFGIFMCFDILTGIKLLRGKPSAVNFAKKFFLVYAIGSLLAVFFPLVYGFSPDDMKMMILDQFKGALQVCFSSGFCVLLQILLSFIRQSFSLHLFVLEPELQQAGLIHQ